MLHARNFIRPLSSAFFSATFIINRAMNVSGTSWAWTASFRFLFALPILFLIVLFRKNLKGLWGRIKETSISVDRMGFRCFRYWFLFFIEFSQLSFLQLGFVAGTWQVTILAGFTFITIILR